MPGGAQRTSSAVGSERARRWVIDGVRSDVAMEGDRELPRRVQLCGLFIAQGCLNSPSFVPRCRTIMSSWRKEDVLGLGASFLFNDMVYSKRHRCPL